VAAAGAGGAVTAVFTFAAERLDPVADLAAGEVPRPDRAARLAVDEVAIDAAQASLSPSGGAPSTSSGPWRAASRVQAAVSASQVAAERQLSESLGEEGEAGPRIDDAEESALEEEHGSQWTL
jgi:hypothetical protein